LTGKYRNIDSRPAFRKSLALFNLHRAIAMNARTVVVVEGFFDTIAVHQAGYPVVGLMASTLSKYQADLLTRHFDVVLLMRDGDEAGRHGSLSAAHALGTRVSVSTISLDDGRQPDQLAPGEIQRLVTGHGLAHTGGDAVCT
jgi:DNA primase